MDTLRKFEITRKVSLILITTSVALSLFSCCRNLGDCQNRSPVILRAIGYTDADIDTLLVLQYEKNSNFNKLVSAHTTERDIQYYYYSTGGDTAFLQVDNDFQSAYDWIIVIKATNQELRLRDLIYGISKEECQGVGARLGECVNPLLSVNINGHDTTFTYTGRPPFFSLVK